MPGFDDRNDFNPYDQGTGVVSDEMDAYLTDLRGSDWAQSPGIENEIDGYMEFVASVDTNDLGNPTNERSDAHAQTVLEQNTNVDGIVEVNFASDERFAHTRNTGVEDSILATPMASGDVVSTVTAAQGLDQAVDAQVQEAIDRMKQDYSIDGLTIEVGESTIAITRPPISDKAQIIHELLQSGEPFVISNDPKTGVPTPNVEVNGEIIELKLTAEELAEYNSAYPDEYKNWAEPITEKNLEAIHEREIANRCYDTEERSMGMLVSGRTALETAENLAYEKRKDAVISLDPQTGEWDTSAIIADGISHEQIAAALADSKASYLEDFTDHSRNKYDYYEQNIEIDGKTYEIGVLRSDNAERIFTTGDVEGFMNEAAEHARETGGEPIEVTEAEIIRRYEQQFDHPDSFRHFVTRHGQAMQEHQDQQLTADHEQLMAEREQQKHDFDMRNEGRLAETNPGMTNEDLVEQWQEMKANGNIPPNVRGVGTEDGYRMETPGERVARLDRDQDSPYSTSPEGADQSWYADYYAEATQPGANPEVPVAALRAAGLLPEEEVAIAPEPDQELAELAALIAQAQASGQEITIGGAEVAPVQETSASLEDLGLGGEPVVEQSTEVSAGLADLDLGLEGEPVVEQTTEVSAGLTDFDLGLEDEPATVQSTEVSAGLDDFNLGPIQDSGAEQTTEVAASLGDLDIGGADPSPEPATETSLDEMVEASLGDLGLGGETQTEEPVAVASGVSASLDDFGI